MTRIAERVRRLERDYGIVAAGGLVPGRKAYEEAAERTRARHSELVIDTDRPVKEVLEERKELGQRLGITDPLAAKLLERDARYLDILRNDSDEQRGRDDAIELAWLDAHQHELDRDQGYRRAELLAEARGDEDSVAKAQHRKRWMRKIREEMKSGYEWPAGKRRAAWLKTASEGFLANRLRRLDKLEALKLGRIGAEAAKARNMEPKTQWAFHKALSEDSDVAFEKVWFDSDRGIIVNELLRRNDIELSDNEIHHLIAAVRRNTGGRPMAELILEAVAAGGKVPTVH